MYAQVRAYEAEKPVFFDEKFSVFHLTGVSRVISVIQRVFRYKKSHTKYFKTSKVLKVLI